MKKSKTFWTGCATVVAGVVIILTGDKINGVQTIAIGLTAIFGRQAISKLEK